MNTTARCATGLGLASAAAALALAAPAAATAATGELPPADAVRSQPSYNPGPPVYNSNAWTRAQLTSQPSAPTSTTTTSSDVNWAQIGYGVAGGVVLASAGAMTIVLVRRHQHLPHHA